MSVSSLPTNPSTSSGQSETPTTQTNSHQTRAFLAFLGGRLLYVVIVLLAIIFLTYFGLDMAGGTPFIEAFGQASGESAAWLGRALFQNDLGTTLAGSDTFVPRPVLEVLGELLPRSFGLLGIALLLAAIVGTLLGIIAASSKKRSLWVVILSILGMSIPSFFAAFLLQLLVTTNTARTGKALIPVGGFGWDKHLILPALVLAARPVAQITRITFVTLKQILAQDFVRTAHAKGLRRRRVLWLHTMKNAAIPILTTIGISMRYSLSTLPVVEFFFGWPGAGRTLLKSIAQRDDDLTVALTVCFGAFFMLVNLLLQLSYRLFDPRLRKQATENVVVSGTLWSGLATVVSGFVDWLRSNPLRRLRGGEPLPPLSKRESKVERQNEGDTLHQRSLFKAILRNTPFMLGSVVVIGLFVLFLFGQQMAPGNPYSKQGITIIDGKMTVPPFKPGVEYEWGSDPLGRDLKSLIFVGAQQTLYLSVLVVSARILIGVFLGALAGWRSGSRLDRLIVGFSGIISAFPTLLLAMILILAIGIRQGIRPFIIAFAFVGWGGIMQFVRSQVITIRPQQYIEGAIALGAGSGRLIVSHVLPNMLPALISIAALEMGAVLILLGELGFVDIFIGGGAFAGDVELAHYSDVPEWGSLLANIRLYARSYPWLALYPALAFFISILGFNLLGEGVRRLVEDGSLVVAKVFNRYTFALALVAALGVTYIRSNSGALAFYKQEASLYSAENAMAHVDVLTADEMLGRALGSDGMGLAAAYIGSQFEAAGLQPAGQNLTFFHERKRVYEHLTADPELAIDGGRTFTAGEDFVIFADYFQSIGAFSGLLRIVKVGPRPGRFSVRTDAFVDLNSKDYSDDVIIVFSSEVGTLLASRRRTGVGAILVVVDETVDFERRITLPGRSGIAISSFTGKEEGADLPMLWITKETANTLLASTGQTVDDYRAEIAEMPEGGIEDEEVDISVSLNVDAEIELRFPVLNVIGHLPGSAGVNNEFQLDDKMIVVLAQYDAPPLGANGYSQPAADDNASGVAVMLEAIRLIQESDYEPYRTFLFVAYSGEGLEGGEDVSDPDVIRFLQAKVGFSTAFEVEAIIRLRGLGGSGDRLEVSAGGSARLTELFESSARRMGAKTVRADDSIDIGIIYDDNPQVEKQDAPDINVVREGWETNSGYRSDTPDKISTHSLDEAGRALAYMLMVLGRELQY